MLKLFKWHMAFIIPFLCVALSSCSEDEPDMPQTPTTSTTKEVSPQIKIVTTATTKDDFTIALRVKSVEKPSVTLSWSAHPSKTSNPSLNKQSTVTKTYDEVEQSGYNWWYYKVTHAGFTPGDYVYYQISAKNSKGSDTSSVGYVIIKR
ncbi:MAG: hypothetical protein NC453_24180 [Muribaculum sp.]|nr:hypothetical protein [Muribaculum sp.]